MASEHRSGRRVRPGDGSLGGGSSELPPTADPAQEFLVWFCAVALGGAHDEARALPELMRRDATNANAARPKSLTALASFVSYP